MKPLVKIFFSMELLVLSCWYIFGSQGIPAIIAMRKENRQLTTEIHCLQSEIQALNETIHEWETTSFYKEKIAREELYMARPDDIIIYCEGT